MAHEYRKAAKESQEKKLKAYGAGDQHIDKAKNWAGFDALNTNEQRGLKPINKEPELSKETAPRIMRKKGGKVVGGDSLKRLDKAPRKARQVGGNMTDPVEAMRSAERLREIRAKKRAEEGPTREEAETINRKQRYSIEDLDARKKGGKVSEIEWEHSKKDLNEDRKLAKKHHMPLEKWEDSALDKKHDKQQSMEGLKKGGRAKKDDGGPIAMGRPSDKRVGKGKDSLADAMRDFEGGLSLRGRMMPEDDISKDEYSRGNLGGGEYALKRGGRAKRADGGPLSSDDDNASSKRTSTKGKTTVNIMVGQPSMGTPGQPAAGVGMMPPPLTGGMPQGAGAPPPPPMPMGMGAPSAPPPGAGAGGGLPPQLMAAMAGHGAPPMARKDGGKVAYKKPGRKDKYPAMDFGAGSGFGRKQKIDAYGTKGPSSKDNY